MGGGGGGGGGLQGLPATPELTGSEEPVEMVNLDGAQKATEGSETQPSELGNLDQADSDEHGE
jgi:hypothetical protein